MSSISSPFANKAQLHVEVGKTSMEELQKFHDDVAAKGGGDIRAKQNKDGSYTLYAPADKKIRLRGIFGQKYKAEARSEKRELAKDLMKEIISRRMPAGKSEESAKALMSKIDKSNWSDTLGKVLKEVSTDVAADKIRERRSVGLERFNKLSTTTQEHYSQLDTILETPRLLKLFGESMKARNCSENLEFLLKAKEYNKTTDPQEKMKLAEEMIKMVEKPGGQVWSIGDAEGAVQINLSAVVAGKIHEEMADLREAFGPGKEPSVSARVRLDALFEGAEKELVRLTKSNNVEAFVKTDAFQAEVGNLVADKSLAQDSPGTLEAGSGLEYQQRVEQGMAHFSNAEEILADPEIGAAFRQHMAADGKAGMIDHYEAMCRLADLAKQPGITDEQLLAAAELALLPQGGAGAPQGGDPLSLDDNNVAPKTPHQQYVSDKLTHLKEMLLESRSLAGDGQDDPLFGRSEVPPKSLVNKQITDFLNNMRGDAANGLRSGGDFHGFKDGELTGLIEKRVGAEMNKEAHDALEFGADKEQHFGSWDRFDGLKLEGSGGATGSGRGKVGKQLYQVKGSIEHAGLGRRLKAGGLNTENYGEVIASNVSRALVGADDRRLIPEVSLRQDQANHEAMVTSRYLAGGKGDLKAQYISEAGPLPKGQKHPKIHLNAPGKSGDGILRLQGQAAKDVQRNIALSALMGDHDVNPGNMIMTKDGRVGRIDFGHAFNELINGPGGSATGGGGVHNKSNRILDFFNRETVSGVPFTSQTKSKLWRDYTGAGPSEGMTEALRTMASSTESLDGLVQAKAQFADLIVALEKEGTPEAQKQIQDLTKSLARMSKNIEKPITSTEPGDVVREVFENLQAFITEGQAQMRDVADLSELQTKIDTFVKSNPPGTPLPGDITGAYQALTAKSVKSPDGEGLVWMKMSAETPAFQGNIDSYVQARRDALTAQI